MRMYSLLDKTSRLYGGVIMGLNDGWMCRALKERYENSNETIGRYPEDFDLYDFGDFSEDGKMVLEKTPRKVCNMSVVLIPPTSNGGGNA